MMKTKCIDKNYIALVIRLLGLRVGLDQGE